MTSRKTKPTLRKKSRANQSPGRQPRRRLMLETLEDRRLLAADIEFSADTVGDWEAVGGNLPSLLVQGTLINDETVEVSVTGGTALEGNDFQNVATVTIQAGVYDGTLATAVAVNLTILDDNVVEADETIELTLQNPTGDLSIGDADIDTVTQDTHVYTIMDDDTVIYTIDDVTVNEGDGTLTFTVSASNPVDIDVTLDVTFTDDTASGSDVDYDSAPVQATFLTGSVLPQSVPMTIMDDQRVEGTESFSAWLGTATLLGGRSVDTDDTGTGTILDNDSAVLGFDLPDSSVPEDDMAHQVTVTLELVTSGTGVVGLDRPVQIDVNVIGGTAAYGLDYLYTGTTLTFGPENGASFSRDVTVEIREDIELESDETVVLELQNLIDGTGGQIGLGQDTHTITIIEDGTLPTRRFDAAVAGQYTIVLSGGDLQIRRGDGAGPLLASEPLGAYQLLFNGSVGDDTLTVDFSGGNPIPSGGLLFNGGLGDDALAIKGTGTENPVYTPDATTFGDGEIDIAGRHIAFTGLEPVDYDSVGTFTLTLPGNDDVVTIADGFLADAVTPALVLSGSSGGVNFEEARVRNSAIVIDTTADDANDTITIASGTSSHLVTNLTIATGVGTDQVQLTGALEVSGDVEILTQEIHFDLGGSLSAGPVNTVNLNAGSGAITRDVGNNLDHITAQTLILNATTGLGGPSLAIRTQVETIQAAVSGTGSIYLNDTSGGVALNGVSTNDGSIKILAEGGALSVANPVSAGGAGDVLLHSTAGNLTVNAPVTAGDDASLVASLGVAQSAAGDVTAAGTLDVEAQGGSITMADGATGSAVGNARYLASQDVTLGGVSGANVWVQATGGSIIDGGDTHKDVAASAAQLVAGGSVGAPAAGAIDTSVATLAASASTGSIYVSEANGLIVGPVAAIAVNRVQLDSTSPSQAGVASAGAVAAMHVKIESGVDAAGDLVVNSPVTATTGDVLLHSTAGNLTVNAAVTAGDDASLVASLGVAQSAAGSVAATGTLDVEAQGGSITMADGATGSAVGNARYLASQDVTLGGVSGANAWVQATGGSIIDGGDTDRDVAAVAAQLVAGESVGAPAAGAIDTSVATLAASASTGSIYVSEANGLIVGPVAAIAVNRVQLDSTSPSQAGVASAGAVAAMHVKIESGVDAAGDLVVNSLVTATAGDVLLHSTAGNLTVNAAVTAGDDASLVASLGVAQSAAGDVTAGGTLDVEAQGGSITMADGATGSAVGNARYLASQDVTLGGVSGANVWVQATGGSIIDGGDTHKDVAAGAAQLVAGGSVGAPAAGAIDTSVATLAASASTGSIYVSEADGLIVGPVAAIAVNRVQLDSTSPSQAGVALAGAVAAMHVKIESGVDAAGDLVVNSSVTATTGDGLLHSTAGNLTVNSPVTAGDDASLVASLGVAQSATGDVTAGGTLDVEAQGGSITMADGATGSAVGNARYLASQDVTLGGVSGANVWVQATGGSIIDGGDTHKDVAAGAAQLVAGGSVGAPAAGAIDTSVATLAASASTGSIYVSEANGLIVGPVAAIAVNRVQLDSTSPSQAGVALAGAVAAMHVKIESGVDAAGDLVVNSSVTATTGDVLLHSTAGNLTVNAPVTAADDASLVASLGVAQSVAGDVTAGGTLDVEAQGGSITMADGATGSSVGNARYLASQDVTLGSVSGANVWVQATGGSIIDGGDTHKDVAAGAAQLVAGGSVGAPAAGAIDTSVATLAASASTGSIYVSEANGLIVGPVAAIAVNRVQLDSTSPSQAGVALAGAVAAMHVKIESGVDAAGDLVVNSSVTATTGDVLLHSTAGNLTVNAPVTAGDDASLVASLGVAQSAAGDVTAGGTLDVEAQGGSISMADGATNTTAGDNVRLVTVDDEDILLGLVDAGNGTGDVSLVAGRHILDSNGSSLNVWAFSLRMVADSLANGNGRVGNSSAGTWAFDPQAIDTRVGRLAAAAAAGVFVLEADDVVVRDTGDIAVNRVHLNSTSTTLMDTSLSDLRTTNNGSIQLVTRDGTITVEDGAPGSIHGNDQYGVVADGTGAILLEARETVGGTAHVNLTASVRSNDGDIRIAAGDDVAVPANVTIETSGKLLVSGDTRQERQQIGIAGNPTGGTFQLSFGVTAPTTTVAIPHNADAATVQAALEALADIGAGNVSVTGGPLPGLPLVVEFAHPLTSTQWGRITADSSGLTGGIDPDVRLALLDDLDPDEGSQIGVEGILRAEAVHVNTGNDNDVIRVVVRDDTSIEEAIYVDGGDHGAATRQVQSGGYVTNTDPPTLPPPPLPYIQESWFIPGAQQPFAAGDTMDVIDSRSAGSGVGYSITSTAVVLESITTVPPDGVLIRHQDVELLNLEASPQDDQIGVYLPEANEPALPAVVTIDGKVGNDRVHLVASSLGDSITVGPLAADPAVRHPVEVANVSCLHLWGGTGDDVLVNDTDMRALIAGSGGNDILVGGGDTDLLFGGAGVDALFGRAGDDYLFSDMDPIGTSYTDDGDLLNGGTGMNSAAQVGLDVIVRINGTLADGGGTKDVLTWLMARITKDPQALRAEAFGAFGCPATYVPPAPVAAVTCTSCGGGGEPEGPLLQNPDNPLDVNADGMVTPLDALLVINHLNQPQDGEAEASSASPSTSFFGDVSGDDVISPIDVLLLVNWLNFSRTAVEAGEGEAAEVTGQSGILWVDIDPTNRGIPAVEGGWGRTGEATEAIAAPLGRGDEARWQLFAGWGGQRGEPRDGMKVNRPDLDVEEDLLALVARDVAGVGPLWNL